MDLSKYAALFLSEGREHVGAMQEALCVLQQDAANGTAEHVAAMFRAVHNIKGMAAAMEYTAVTGVAHALESVLDGVRTGEERLTPSLVEHLVDETDALARAIEVAGAPSMTSPMTPSTRQRATYVRVEAARLDALTTVAGELEIARDRLERVSRDQRRAGGDALDAAVTRVSRLIAELRDQIVTTRMVPVAHVFDRFPRLVRETARALGKDVDFTIDGKEIELDRSMLDEIGDPVVHLLRNALDHGVEGGDERELRKKPRRARLTLGAQRESNYVLIRVSDDGRGIDRERVLGRARRMGVVPPEQTRLDDTELLGVLTRPGFSTADHVTDLSGRGVGLDVVDVAVRALGGALELRSVLGCGTAVTMRLPLTVAIVRALLARLGNETYAIPVTHALETVELDPETVPIEETSASARAAVIRDQRFPIIPLREVMGLPPRHTARPKAVAVSVGGRRGVLVVDEFVGQQDVVVKRFAPAYGAPALFGGATILNDGAPALIVDVNSVI